MKIVLLFFFAVYTQDQYYSISQLSPKSAIHNSQNENENIHTSAAYYYNEIEKVESENKDDLKIFTDDGVKIKSDTFLESRNIIEPTQTKKHYEGKTSEKNDPFLVKRDRGAAKAMQRSRSLSMEKKTTTSASPKTPIASINNDTSYEARQNNGDIQDIITGIVKLLNGNVNVHANQGNRMPLNNRINNRGPPKIAEAQIPLSEIPDPSKIPTQSQSYQFDRPDGHSRPFLTGVPLPEQIVPSIMQQNYRPGFISQNRHPWTRPKPPRPPHNRRPMPTLNRPTIPAFNNNNENEKTKIDVETHHSMMTNDSTQYELNTTSIAPSITTIVQSTSEINAVFDDDDYDSVYEKNETANEIEPSILDNFSQIHLSSTQTPSLEPVLETTSATFDKTTTSSATTTSVIEQKSSTYFPRLGVVLDDPDFKPGQNKNKINSISTTPSLSYKQPPQQDFMGYGEIFDVTLTAIQGPSGNTGSQQTVNVNPYNNYQGSDIILNPSGDQNFVSIDGKRTYFNLFSDISGEPTSSHIEPTKVKSTEVKGTGYVIPENPPSIKKTTPNNNSKSTIMKKPILPPPSNNVRIDTCIIGDDSTCDQSQNEKCKIENGISSCNCKPGNVLSQNCSSYSSFYKFFFYFLINRLC